MRKFLALVLLLTTAAALIGCGENSVEDRKEQAKYRRITPDEAQVLMRQEQDYLILDVRSPEEYEQGHIPHAINIPIERIGDVPPKEPAGSESDDLCLLFQGRSQHECIQSACAHGL